MTAEGWYRDPFAAHADRWFSDGVPTTLVRDGTVEGHDEVPEGGWEGDLVDVDESDSFNGDDLRLADDSTSIDNFKQRSIDAAFDAVTRFGGSTGATGN